MTKDLIAVISCDHFRARADAQRATWVPFVRRWSGADTRFFIGGGMLAARPDEISLDVPDGYWGLSQKVRAVCQWALQHGYERLFKIDDDVYVCPRRLFTTSSGSDWDYAGHIPVRNGVLEHEQYASGFAYWLGHLSLKIIASAKITDNVEDRWVGRVLRGAAISCHHVDGFRVVHSLNVQNIVTGTASPLATNNVIAACEFTPKKMFEVHDAWIRSNSCDSLDTLGIRWEGNV